MIAAIIGEGGSGGAIALAAGNAVLMLEHAIYTVISPEGCASILWRDAAHAQEAAEALRLTAQDLLRLGVIDRIVPEPLGGAHRLPQEAIAALGEALDEALAPAARRATAPACAPSAAANSWRSAPSRWRDRGRSLGLIEIGRWPLPTSSASAAWRRRPHGRPPFPRWKVSDGPPGTRSDHDPARAPQERRRAAERPGSRRADPPGHGGAAGRALLPRANRADPGSEPASGAEPHRRTGKAIDRRPGGGRPTTSFLGGLFGTSQPAPPAAGSVPSAGPWVRSPQVAAAPPPQPGLRPAAARLCPCRLAG